MSKQAVVKFEDFKTEITQRMEDELCQVLPPHIPAEKFKATAIMAVKNDPSLLNVDRRSLHKAVTQAAEDGLMPDSREGVITTFKGEATWNPMLRGIRKRAKEIGGVIIDAQVVHANDHFVHALGDDPRIEHHPADLDADPGPMVGAYAIFRQDGVILHREIMTKKQIEKVQSMSRAKNGPMWTKFAEEAWKKTVVRRGIKSVPSVPELERVVSRVDADFPQFNKSNVVELKAVDTPPPIEPEPEVIEAEVIPPAPPEEGEHSHLEDFDTAIKLTKTRKAAEKIWDRFKDGMPEDQDAYINIFEAHMDFLEGA